MSFFSPAVRRNPFPIYERLRQECPVFYDAGAQAWLLSDYDSVRRALTDQESFSSAVTAGPTLGKWLIFLDPPRHTRLRALILRAFTPRAIAALEPRIAQLSRELLEPLLPRGECELVREYAVPLPLMVIAELLGAPAQDYPLFRGWSEAVLALIHTVSADERAAAAVPQFTATSGEMRDYLRALVAARRRTPQADLITGLLNASVDGEALALDDLLGFFQLLLVAGHETTTNLVTNAVICLQEQPAAWASLRADPQQLPCAIEEVLRYRSPVQAAFRRTRREVELNEQRIPAGALVLALIGSANRDARYFTGANTLDIARNPNPHLAFGHGLHFCIGSALARLEAKIALTDLIQSFDQVALLEPEWPARAAFHVHGPDRLSLRFERRAGTC